MKFNVQLINVNLKMDGESYIVFGTSLSNVLNVAPLANNDVGIEFSIEGAESDKISGHVYSVSISSGTVNDPEARCKFRLNCPASENIKVAELSTLYERDLVINIDIINNNIG